MNSQSSSSPDNPGSKAPGEKSNLHLLNNCIREISRVHLVEFGGIDRVMIEELKPVKEVASLWTASISANGTQARIKFRTYFDLLAAKTLASGTYGRSAGGLTSDQAYDFMKEYCNLCIGKIKRLLANNDIPLAIGFATVTRGFEGGTEPVQNEPTLLISRWVLVSRLAKLTCSVRVEAPLGIHLEKLDDPDAVGKVEPL